MQDSLRIYRQLHYDVRQFKQAFVDEVSFNLCLSRRAGLLCVFWTRKINEVLSDNNTHIHTHYYSRTPYLPALCGRPQMSVEETCRETDWRQLVTAVSTHAKKGSLRNYVASNWRWISIPHIHTMFIRSIFMTEWISRRVYSLAGKNGLKNYRLLVYI